jgi:hypothetical protein
LELAAPDRSRSRLVVAYKASLEPKEIPQLVAGLRRGANGVPVVATRFASPRAREILESLGAGYTDETGNVGLSLERPAVFIRLRGEERNPWREKRPLQSLKGSAAARVVRALCDFAPPYGVRELATRSGAPLGTTSRVVSLLDRDAIVERTDRGPIGRVDWEALIRRWVRDYSLTKSNEATMSLAPRGIPEVVDRLRKSNLRYAVTATLAAAEVTAAAPPRLAAVYFENVDEAAARLGLRPAESGANVMLLAPLSDVVFDRTWKKNGVVFAAYSQVAADLLTGPGRGPSEGEELIAWMREHEKKWRATR